MCSNNDEAARSTDCVRALQAQINALHAQQLLEIARLDRLYASVIGPGFPDAAREEVALGLRLTEHQARTRLRTARALTDRLHHTREQGLAGRLSLELDLATWTSPLDRTIESPSDLAPSTDDLRHDDPAHIRPRHERLMTPPTRATRADTRHRTTSPRRRLPLLRLRRWVTASPPAVAFCPWLRCPLRWQGVSEPTSLSPTPRSGCSAKRM